MLATMLPIRDRRDRVVGYTVSSCAPSATAPAASSEAEARATVDSVPRFARLAGRSVVVPVMPSLVRDGTITRFASTDAVWLVATSALDEAGTRRAVERLTGQGFHFALDGFPEGEPLPPTLAGATLQLDAWHTPPAQLEGRIGRLIEAGLRPMVRGVDDRATRQRALAAGAALHSGRTLVRGASAVVNRDAEARVLRTLATLAAFSDGRPPDAAFDAFIEDDADIGAALVKAMSSAALGVRGPRSVKHALNMLGRDAVMEQLVTVIARMIGEAAGDPELAFLALRRARVCERAGAALEPVPHPRARSAAGLLSVLEFAFGTPAYDVAGRLELSPTLRDTLERRARPLGMLLDAVDAIDYGWWDDFRARCALLGISPLMLSDAHLEAWRDARDELGHARLDVS